MALNISHPETLELLLSRRSVLAGSMVEPGPSGADLERILQAGMRVPDHGKLTPWRFIVIEGEARAALGREIERCYMAEEPEPKGITARALANFPCQAPLLVVVVSRLSDAKPIPEWEQILSAGAACKTMLIAAHALGFVGQWLTGWAAYSKGVGKALGLQEGDRIAGFLFFGSAGDEPKERDRPDYDDIVSRWQGR